MTKVFAVSSTPEILRLARLLDEAPRVKSEPLVGLAHRTMFDASDGELGAFLVEFFEECWLARLSPSQALSLVWISSAGNEASFRKLTPEVIWEQFGAASYSGRSAVVETAPPRRQLSPAPDWWGSEFRAWAVANLPDIPTSFANAVGFGVLSALIGTGVETPVGTAELSIVLAGANSRIRRDALALGGTLELDVESLNVDQLLPVADRLTAVETDDALAGDGTRERQRRPSFDADPTLALLVSRAWDGLEAAQAVSRGQFVVESSPGALDAVSALRGRLAERYRALRPSTLDDLLSGSSLLVRKMAALVTVSEGAIEVSALHQEIANAGALGSIEAVAQRLATGSWNA